MGDTQKYYKKALQTFASILNKFDDKDKISEKDFYFDAGRTYQCIVDESENDGCDGMNACIGGLASFCALIGMGEEENEE